MKYTFIFLIFFLTFCSEVEEQVKVNSIEELYEILPIQDTSLYDDYFENYKEDDLNKAVAVTIDKNTSEFTWNDDFAWGVGFGWESKEKAKEIAIEECNVEKYSNEVCIIIIVNNSVVHPELLNLIKSDVSIKAEDDFSKLEKDSTHKCTNLIDSGYKNYPECIVQSNIEKNNKITDEILSQIEIKKKEELEAKKKIEKEKQILEKIENEKKLALKKAEEDAAKANAELELAKLKAEQKLREEKLIEAEKLMHLERQIIEQLMLKEKEAKKQKQLNFWLSLGASDPVQPGESMMQTIFSAAKGQTRNRAPAPVYQNNSTTCRFLQGWPAGSIRCY